MEKNSEQVIPFEPDYETIKKNPNFMYQKYEKEIEKLCQKVGFFRYIPWEELLGIAYIYFAESCKKYDPYYNNNFKSFGAFWYGYTRQRLYSHMQKYFYKQKREQPTDFMLINNSMNASMNNEFPDEFALQDSYCFEDNFLFKTNYQAFLNSLSDLEKKVFLLTLNGAKQTEIAQRLGIAQSAVSITFAKAKRKLVKYFDIDINEYKNLRTKKLFNNCNLSYQKYSMKIINKLKSEAENLSLNTLKQLYPSYPYKLLYDIKNEKDLTLWIKDEES